MEEYQEYPSHYPGQPHMPVRRRRVTFRKHFQNQWDNSRGFFKQWWHQKKGSKQQPASYYPPQTGAGVLRPQKRQRKHYQYGGSIINGVVRKQRKHYQRRSQYGGNIKNRRSFEGKQSGSGMGNLTRKTPRKALNTVPTHFQYHQ